MREPGGAGPHGSLHVHPLMRKSPSGQEVLNPWEESNKVTPKPPARKLDNHVRAPKDQIDARIRQLEPQVHQSGGACVHVVFWALQLGDLRGESRIRHSSKVQDRDGSETHLTDKCEPESQARSDKHLQL